MAEGRDLAPRSPRWVNALIWSTGLGAAAWFLWQTLLCDGEPTCMPVGLVKVVTRALGCALLPVLMLTTFVGRGARRVVE